MREAGARAVCLCVAAVLSSGAALSNTAAAQEPLQEDRDAEARLHFRAARSAFAEERWDDALRNFQRAYELSVVLACTSCGTDTPAQLVLRVRADAGIAIRAQCVRVETMSNGEMDSVELPGGFPKFVVVTPRGNDADRDVVVHVSAFSDPACGTKIAHTAVRSGFLARSARLLEIWLYDECPPMGCATGLHCETDGRCTTPALQSPEFLPVYDPDSDAGLVDVDAGSVDADPVDGSVDASVDGADAEIPDAGATGWVTLAPPTKIGASENQSLHVRHVAFDQRIDEEIWMVAWHDGDGGHVHVYTPSLSATTLGPVGDHPVPILGPVGDHHYFVLDSGNMALVDSSGTEVDPPVHHRCVPSTVRIAQSRVSGNHFACTQPVGDSIFIVRGVDSTTPDVRTFTASVSLQGFGADGIGAVVSRVAMPASLELRSIHPPDVSMFLGVGFGGATESALVASPGSPHAFHVTLRSDEVHWGEQTTLGTEATGPGSGAYAFAASDVEVVRTDNGYLIVALGISGVVDWAFVPFDYVPDEGPLERGTFDLGDMRLIGRFVLAHAPLVDQVLMAYQCGLHTCIALIGRASF